MDRVAIAASGLTMRFNGFTAVDSVDLQIYEGELFGLLGPNGAGKSTMIKMLTTMLRPSAGSAQVCGHNVVTDRDAVRSSVGVVFQDISIDNKLTARENLDFHARMYGMEKKLRLKRIDEVLELVDLTDKADIILEDYSGGMQRRLEIARGLMHHPLVLFLDEPTLGLDAQTRRYIWEYIKEMNQLEGVTVVLTTHYMDEADYLCDRVAIIDHGKIVVLDTPENLKDKIGSDIIIVDLQEGHEELVQALSSFEWVKSAKLNNGMLTLSVEKGESKIPDVVLSASSLGVKIRSVILREPTLEDVFLKYTGRKIRDADSDGQNRILQRMRRRWR